MKKDKTEAAAVFFSSFFFHPSSLIPLRSWVRHEYSLRYSPAAAPAHPEARDRGVCSGLRPGLLRDDLRGHRRRGPQRSGGLRRLPHALSALVVRHVLRGAEEGLRL